MIFVKIMTTKSEALKVLEKLLNPIPWGVAKKNIGQSILSLSQEERDSLKLLTSDEILTHGYRIYNKYK